MVQRVDQGERDAREKHDGSSIIPAAETMFDRRMQQQGEVSHLYPIHYLSTKAIEGRRQGTGARNVLT